MIRLINQIPRRLVVAIVGIMISLFTGGIWFYKVQKQTLRQQTEATLQTIAQLKMNTLVQWRLERFLDNTVITESPFLNKIVEQWQKDPQLEITEQLMSKFRSLGNNYQYSDVQLVDRFGKIQLSLAGNTESIDNLEVQALVAAWRERKPQLSDLHQDTFDPFPHITGIAPLFGGKGNDEPIGAILLRIDARQFLYPLLQSWPVPSESGETLIVEKSGNDVVFLNDLRYRPDSALKFYIPLTESEVPAVMAIQGRRGLVYGRDYRGVAVMAVITSIQNTPWFLVAKIDQTEALASWYLYAPLTIALILVLIAIVAAITVILAWRQIAHTYHQDLFRSELARREGEENLQHLEIRYRTYFEQSRDGIGMVDPSSTKILDANEAWCKMLGYTRDELLQMTIVEIEGNIPQETQERNEAIRSQGWAEFEAPMIHKNGQKIHTLVTATQVVINEQLVLLGTIRNITERKYADALLKESQKRLQLIFTSTTNGLLVANDEGRIIMTNPAIETMLGYTQHELIGKPVEILVPVEKRDWHVELRQAFFMTPSHQAHNIKREVRAQHRDGREILIEISLNHFDSTDERLALAMVVDITERIQAKIELEKSRESWRNLAEAMPHMVWSCTSDGHRDYISHQWVDYTGDSDMNNWINQIHPEDRDRTSAAWRHSIQTGENYDLEYRIHRHDGIYRWFKVRGTSVLDSNGKIIKWHGCNIDIEDIKKSEQAAGQANRAKSEFLANMSHEIRTPMNAIIGLTQLVLDTALNPKQQDYLKKVKNSAQALLGILNDILDYSKLDAGRLTLEAVDFTLDDILHNLSALFSFQAEEKGIEIFFEITPGLPSDLNGDPLRLGQILSNLVGNAVKFTECGNIHVKVERTKNFNKVEQLQFSIHDTGIGMTTEQMTQLFRSFNQGDRSTTRKYGGTGLGLTISKHLIEQMGGNITVESTFGRGSTFCFTIPLCPAREALHKRRIVSLQSMKTLIVDDQETSLEILNQMLHSSSFDVALAHSGKEGLEMVAAAQKLGTPFELVLIDWKMPEMNGIELARHLREQEVINEDGRHSLVLMITAFGREDVLQTASEIPIDAVLEKPVTPSRLFDTIADLQHRKVPFPFNSRSTHEHIDLFEMTRSIHGARLLLVEDNPTNQIVAREFLEKMGLVVEIAHHGREAVDKVAHQHYDAVLMDLQMPEMDGFEAARKIRLTARGGTIPIIAMTAAAMLEDKQAATAAGMNGHLAKPIDTHELATTLLKWIPSMRSTPFTGEKSPDLYEKNKQSNEPIELQTEISSPFELPGLDLVTAVKRLNNDWSFLRTILLSFRTNFIDSNKRVNDYLTTGDRSDAIRLAHTVKGLGKSIGAIELAILAERFEHELREDRETVSRLPFETALETVLSSIGTLILPVDQEIPSFPLDRIRVRWILDELRTRLKNSTIIPSDLLEEIRVQLLGHIETRLFNDFITEIELFAFTDAQRTLEKIAIDLGLDLKIKV